MYERSRGREQLSNSTSLEFPSIVQAARAMTAKVVFNSMRIACVNSHKQRVYVVLSCMRDEGTEQHAR